MSDGKKRLNMLPPNPEKNTGGCGGGSGCGTDAAVGPGRFPSWLHRKLPTGVELWNTSKVITENRLHTVCEEAKCPNQMHCWSKKTATFLIMGKECTRNCGFCDIDFTKHPQPLQLDEPDRVADSVKKLGLKHVVITMVARDDLPDGGAAQVAKTIEVIRREVPAATIEVLTSDFKGNLDSLKIVLEAYPEVFNHNIETVRALTPRVRHTATYDRTLSVLKAAHDSIAICDHTPALLVKSGLMVGLGETEEQVHETLHDLKNVGCDIVTMGQYLQPNRQKLLVKAFITPEQFKKYEDYGYSIGLKHMYCGPFVRSSYNADIVIAKISQPPLFP
ncbi:MAG: lipoyl synthase [Parachlamydiaceae bacterium]|nr:lipoyl synthase [Parachlamydiaceae bacterium]